jgi:hypothetical protein
MRPNGGWRTGQKRPQPLPRNLRGPWTLWRVSQPLAPKRVMQSSPGSGVYTWLGFGTISTIAYVHHQQPWKSSPCGTAVGAPVHNSRYVSSNNSLQQPGAVAWYPLAEAAATGR